MFGNNSSRLAHKRLRLVEKLSRNPLYWNAGAETFSSSYRNVDLPRRSTYRIRTGSGVPVGYMYSTYAVYTQGSTNSRRKIVIVFAAGAIRVFNENRNNIYFFGTKIILRRRKPCTTTTTTFVVHRRIQNRRRHNATYIQSHQDHGWNSIMGNNGLLCF